METTISFGYWIRRQRKALDLTQQALAERVGCSLAAIKKIEQDERRPSRQIAELLADALGVTGNQRETFLDVARGLRPVDQLSPEDEGATASGIRPQQSFLHNLPLQLTSFIGREKEIADVIRLLEKARLVTLTGPGGTGKTRLAIQVANQVVAQYPDGVWMVELAPILDPLLVPRSTALAMGLRGEPHRPVIDMLCDHVEEKNMLLLLDNGEHLIEACAQMADTLLHACPQIHILATSREALGMAGETLYLVPSLTRPDIRNLPSLESLNEYEAIKLFVDRATSVIPTFTLTDENASSIVEICQRLDGIPLAIELAAGKIRALSIGQIVQRLNDRFHLLTGGSRTSLPRYQTLQAAIDWSYNLLSPAEQTLFRRLSVFVNGWTLEAAESICSDISVTKDDVLGLLEHLINKSIIILEDARYHMLETIRQYANEKLVEFGESNWLRDRHLEYFFNLVQTAAPHLLRPEQLDWLPLLDADYQNLRHVLEWSLRPETAEVALKLCNALWWFWKIRSYWLEGLNWTKRALAMPSKTESRNEKAARAKALATQAGLEWQLSNFEQILAPAQASLALALEVSDRREIAIAKFYVGTALRNKDGHLASGMHQQSFAEFESLNDEFWQAFSFPSLVEFPEKAKRKPYEWFVRCLELAREAGERYVLADVLWSYAFWLFGNNRLAEARAYAEESDRLLKEIGSENTSLNSAVFAEIAWLEGDTQKARTLFMELNERLGLLGDKVYRRSYITALGLLAMEEGDLHQAQLYFELALHMSREMGHKGFLAESLIELSNLYYFKGKLDAFKQNFRKSLSLKNYFSEYDKAYVLTVTLGFLYLQKQEQSALLLGALTSPEREYNLLFSQIRKRTLGRAETYARKNLGDAAFESAFAEGRKMSLDEALNLVMRTIDEI